MSGLELTLSQGAAAVFTAVAIVVVVVACSSPAQHEESIAPHHTAAQIQDDQDIPTPQPTPHTNEPENVVVAPTDVPAMVETDPIWLPPFVLPAILSLSELQLDAMLRHYVQIEPPEDIQWSRWYAVTVARRVGVFRNWLDVTPHIHRVSGHTERVYKTRAEALDAFEKARADGKVVVHRR